MLVQPTTIYEQPSSCHLQGLSKNKILLLDAADLHEQVELSNQITFDILLCQTEFKFHIMGSIWPSSDLDPDGGEEILEWNSQNCFQC